MLKNPPKWYSPYNLVEGVVNDPNPRSVPIGTVWAEEAKTPGEKAYRLAFVIAEKLDELGECLRDPKENVVNKDMLIDLCYAKAEHLRNKVELMKKPINPKNMTEIFDQTIKLAENIEALLKNS